MELIWWKRWQSWWISGDEGKKINNNLRWLKAEENSSTHVRHTVELAPKIFTDQVLKKII
jgi:hypothetical protein